MGQTKISNIVPNQLRSAEENIATQAEEEGN